LSSFLFLLFRIVLMRFLLKFFPSIVTLMSCHFFVFILVSFCHFIFHLFYFPSPLSFSPCVWLAKGITVFSYACRLYM
jgi:hypothetical protein